MAQKVYSPLTDAVYMSPQMKEFFKQKLYEELEKLNRVTAVEENQPQADFIDQGTAENLQQISHAFQEHENLLSRQIELALRRLACGTYGYCVVTGEPIGISRLIAAPYTPYCLDAQEDQEKQKYFPIPHISTSPQISRHY